MGSGGFISTLLAITLAIVSLVWVMVTTAKSQIGTITSVPAQSPSPSVSPTQTSPPTPAPTPIPSPSPAPTTARASPVPSSGPSPQADADIEGAVTKKGNYTVLTYDLASTTVVTDTASDNDCATDCPTKPIAQYISENGGRAGMNGTYFCPVDYSACSSKVNSFDFPVWNNRRKIWINSSNLFWDGRGMMVFRAG